jgi:hypothetical protein
LQEATSVPKDSIPDALGFTLRSFVVGQEGAAEADGLFDTGLPVHDADAAGHEVLAVFTCAIESELPPDYLQQRGYFSRENLSLK